MSGGRGAAVAGAAREGVSPETRPAQAWRAAGKKALVNGLSMVLVAAWDESTAGVKYFLASGGRRVGRISRVGFRRRTVEHVFRVAKPEVGVRGFEGRTDTDLVRHLILSLSVPGFVAVRTDRPRGESPEVALEQVWVWRWTGGASARG